MKALIATLTTIVAVGMFVTASPVVAKTPDGRTPANEAVCDPLQEDGVTKGLYGLCVAFCEAHDAVDEDTPITEDQLSDILASSPDGQILKNYNKKKAKANNPNDPDMPCIVMQEPCPCWSEAEIAGIDGLYFDTFYPLILVCSRYVSNDSTLSYDAISETCGTSDYLCIDFPFNYVGHWAGVESKEGNPYQADLHQCLYIRREWPLVEEHPTIYRKLSVEAGTLTEGQFAACWDSLDAHQARYPDPIGLFCN